MAVCYLFYRFTGLALVLWTLSLPIDEAPNLTGDKINLIRVLLLCLLLFTFLTKYRCVKIPFGARCHAVIVAVVICLNALSSFINGHSIYVIFGLWFYALTFIFFTQVISYDRLSSLVLWTLIVGATGACLIAILQWLIIVFGIFPFLEFLVPPSFRSSVGLPLFTGGAISHVRVQGTFYSPNALGPYIMVTIILALSMKMDRFSKQQLLQKVQKYFKGNYHYYHDDDFSFNFIQSCHTKLYPCMFYSIYW